MSIIEQPAPVANDNPPSWPMVIEDLRCLRYAPPTSELVIADAAARDDLGLRRYGVRLQPGNGRNSLVDAYDEAMDLAVYLKTALLETEASEPDTDEEVALKSLLCGAMTSQYGTALRMCLGLRDLIHRRAIMKGKS
jgi:hypothetical protein